MDWFRSSVIRPAALSVFFAFLIVAIIPSNAPAYAVGIDGARKLDEARRTADISKVQRVLESKVVGQKLEGMGLTPTEVEERLSMLSNSELHQFATQVENVYSGEAGVGLVVIIAALLVLIVFAFLSLTDRRLVLE